MGVLDSIRVVELTEALAGPYCAMMLGDFGADVIKVERRVTGDQSRSWGPPFVGTESAYFLSANRNKRSLSLDYDHPLGAAILDRLLATADVFLINQRNPASLKRRGLDAQSVCARHPRLVYCAISGFGQSGPRSGLAGYDIIAQAQAGIMSFTGEPEGEPVRYPIAIADMACGLYSTIGILAALLAREKTGVGQALDMALFDSQLTLLINTGSNFLNAGESPQRWGNAHASIVPYQVFRAGDGRHFVAAIGTDGLWRRLLHIIDATRCAQNIARC
jgi:crotonobetainyl-CoA:carnitine CoA-transferase CaiB-like acyl-CoA transferase